MFYKLKEAIYNNYLTINNIDIKTTKLNCSDLTYDINSIYYNCLKSYYFENIFNDFKFLKTKTPEGDYYFISGFPLNERDNNKSSFSIKYEFKDDIELNNIINEKNINSKTNFTNLFVENYKNDKYINLSPLEYKNMTSHIDLKYLNFNQDIFSFQYDSNNEEYLDVLPFNSPYHTNRELIDPENNQRIEKTINELLKYPEFSLLLEKDPIKKILNLKNKYNFKFDIFSIDSNEYNNPSEKSFRTLLSFENDYDLESSLSNVYGLAYYVGSNDKKYELICAHNSNEICGLTMLIDANTYHSNINRDIAKYVSFIEVSQPFYGHKLGVSLMKEAIKHAEDNNLILFRTDSSTLGEMYIKEKINTMAKESTASVVSTLERNCVIKLLSQDIYNKKSPHKDVKELLNMIRGKYTEKDLENNAIQNEILETIKIKSKAKNNIY